MPVMPYRSGNHHSETLRVLIYSLYRLGKPHSLSKVSKRKYAITYGETEITLTTSGGVHWRDNDGSAKGTCVRSLESYLRKIP